MSTPDPQHAFVERAAPWIAGLLVATPVLVAFYPPMTDLPFHEAGIGLLRHFGDRAMEPPGLYTRNLGEPNQLFHLGGWALSLFVSTRWAVKLMVAATLVAIPVCAARFARSVGSSPLAALVVAPLGLGWLFSWGLVANLVGLAVLLATLPLLDALASRPTGRAAGLAVTAVPLLYVAHEAMLLAYAGAALLLAVVSPGSRRATAWRLLPFGACVAAVAGEAIWQRDRRTPTVQGIGATWDPVARRIAHLPAMLMPGDAIVRIAMTALVVTAVAALFVLRARGRRAEQITASPAPDGSRWRLGCSAHRWEIFAAAGVGAYLAFPTTLYGATYLHHRWFAPAFSVLALVAAPPDLWSPAARIARACLLALPIAPLLAAWPAFSDSSRLYADLDPLLDRIEPGSAVVELELGPDDPSRSFSLGPAYGRALATRGGRLLYSFTDSPIFPVVMPRAVQWNEAAVRVAFDCWRFEPARDLRRFRYVLVHAGDPALALLATFALQPEAEVVAQSGEWTLFASRLPVTSVVAPDAPLDVPSPETFRKRMQAAFARLRAPPDVHLADAPSPLAQP